MKISALFITAFASIALAADKNDKRCKACSKTYILCGMVKQPLSFEKHIFNTFTTLTTHPEMRARLLQGLGQQLLRQEVPEVHLRRGQLL
jgi:hypothetical protein